MLLNAGEYGFAGYLFETARPLSKLSVVVGFEETGARVTAYQRAQLISAWQEGFDLLHLHKMLRVLLLGRRLRTGTGDRA